MVSIGFAEATGLDSFNWTKTPNPKRGFRV